MSWTIDASDWTRQLSSPFYDGNFTNSLRPSAQTAVAMSLSLSTAGRLGFFIDYSERETVGTHTFYVTRTHGSQGAVGCTWTAYDSADGAQLATGTLSWNDLSLDILSFEVNVPNKPAGDHRIYVLLSNPTGGAVLHHGADTVAYGIIDDDTIAESNAIFIDADAVTDGDGSQGNPYNNWYSARDAVITTTRTIYIKGKMIPDGTDTVTLGQPTKCLEFKGTFRNRVSENQRLVIRNWPTFVGGIDGGGQTDVTGFNCYGVTVGGAAEYITLRGLEATNLDNTNGGASLGKCFFIRTRSFNGRVDHWTAENINIDGVISGAGGATAVWFIEDCNDIKAWRWNTSNTTKAFITEKLFMMETYEAENVSIQRCTLNRTAGGIYQKSGTPENETVGMTCRFNYFDGPTIRISTLSARLIQSFHIIQNNIFDASFKVFDFSPIALDAGNSNTNSQGQHISNNVFYDYSFSSLGSITVEDVGFLKAVLYNNIHNENQKPWVFRSSASPAEFIDFNHYQNASVSTPSFNYLGIFNLSLASVISTLGFEINSTTGDPLFTDAVNGDFTLAVVSPALNSGVSGTQKGAYIAPFINIGAN